MEFPDEAIALRVPFTRNRSYKNRALKLETTHLSSIKCNNANVSRCRVMSQKWAESGLVILLKTTLTRQHAPTIDMARIKWSRSYIINQCFFYTFTPLKINVKPDNHPIQIRNIIWTKPPWLWVQQPLVFQAATIPSIPQVGGLGRRLVSSISIWARWIFLGWWTDSWRGQQIQDDQRYHRQTLRIGGAVRIVILQVGMIDLAETTMLHLELSMSPKPLFHVELPPWKLTWNLNLTALEQ